MMTYLAKHAADASEEEALRKLISERADYLTVLDLLERFPSIKVDVGDMLQLLPGIVARDYTIASSSVVSPTKLRIAISLTEDTRSDGGVFRGLTSEFI